MKTGFNKIFIALCLITFASPAFAVGSLILAYFGFTGAALTVGAFLINMVVSTVIAKTFFSPNQPSYGPAGDAPNPGNRQQVPPATDNKLPVVYGSAYLGGVVTDLIISNDNQKLLYCLSLCEVTNTNDGQTPDVISFGDIYYAGKKVIFDSSGNNVIALLDESTGLQDTTVKGKIQIYLYSNGVNYPANTNVTANQITLNLNGDYYWDYNVKMSNCAFALIVLTYSISANVRGIAQTKFQVINSRTNTGDCIQDYLTNTRYGAALPISQVDVDSLNALTTYSNQLITYTPSTGGTAQKPRFKFNGTVDTARTIMANLQDMASCCDSLIRYNEITAQWGVIIQKSTYTVAMQLNDSNIISGISISPLDLANTYNVIETKFPDKVNQDAFNSVLFDLAVIEPSLLFPNEPVNKQAVSLPYTNNDVTAQLIAIRMLKSARDDLIVQCQIGYTGLQLDAGDIVEITNTNYGWTNKPFRLTKISQSFKDDGQITVQLTASEFNASVYDDASITEFTPADNSSIGSPMTFGTLFVPVVQSSFPEAVQPYFNIQLKTSSAGTIQYAELWYSAYANPTETQLIFLGTSEIQSNGTPWLPNTDLPLIQITGIPSGQWYFFTRMVNSIGSSPFSLHSILLNWNPRTYNYTNQYVAIAYADNASGLNFSLTPTDRLYYGVRNQADQNISLLYDDYTWYLADPDFGTNKFLLYTNRQSRKFSFAVGFAANAAGSGAFVPSQALLYDPSIWAALPPEKNIIDLDVRTGQLLISGTTSTGTGEIIVSNTNDGQFVASLNPFLNFGEGVVTYTINPATITIDRYGRVIGFVEPDNFYFTKNQFTATAGQTVFTPTARQPTYITGTDLIFKNGLLLKPTTDYTETSTTFTLTIAATLNDNIICISMRTLNGTGGSYASFTRNYVTLTDANTYTASGFTLNSGFEFLFLNGSALTDQDYDISDQTLINFPNLMTGELCVLQWTANNLGLPNTSAVNVSILTVIDQSTYTFNLDPNAFNLFMNGVLFNSTSDYTTSSTGYSLTTAPLVDTSIMLQQTFARVGAA
jgi:hypothetical protein